MTYITDIKYIPDGSTAAQIEDYFEIMPDIDISEIFSELAFRHKNKIMYIKKYKGKYQVAFYNHYNYWIIIWDSKCLASNYLKYKSPYKMANT